MDEIVVKYDADVKKMQDALKKVEDQQIDVEKGAKKITDAYDKQAGVINNLRGNIDKLTIARDKSNSPALISIYNKKIDEANNKLKGLTTSTKDVTKEVNGLKGAFQTLLNNLPFAGATQQVTQLGNAFTGVTQTLGKTSGAMNILKVAFASIGIVAIIAAFSSIITYFKSTEEGADKLAKILRVVGAVFGEVVKIVSNIGGVLFNAGEAMFDFIQGTDIAAKSTDDYKKSVVELGAEIADLQDRIEELTITLDLQNDKLQTGIENNLRKLRNKNILLKESLDVINKIGSLEEKKLSNSNLLIEEKLKLERKDFLLKTQDFGADKQRIEELQHLAQVGNESGREFAREELKRFDDIIAKNKEKGKIFDQFVKGEIDASQILDQAKGTFQQEDVKRIADILKQREAAVRESGNLEERLQNFKDAALDKDKARQDKISADEKARQDKAFANAVKQIDIQEKLAVGLAKIEGRDQGNIIAIEEGFNKKKIELFQQFGKEKTTEYQELILGQKNLEKEYTDFLQKEDDRRIADAKEIADKELKEKQTELDKEKAEEIRIRKEISAELDTIAQDELKKIQDRSAKEKAIKIAALQETIDISSQLLHGFTDLKLANVNAEVNNERASNDAQTQSLLDNLDKRKEAGLLSDQQVARKKEQIQKGAAIKEAKLKEKLWKAEQNAQLTRIAIDAAVGVAKAVATYLSNPLTALATPVVVGGILASAAIQAAFIKAQPMPKFKDGVIDLQGQGTGTSDSINARLSKGESVMTAKETSQYKPLFESIREGKFEKYAYENIARPAMKREAERQRKKDSMSENLLKSIQLNGLDTSHLERLTKSNKNVKIANAKEIADELAKVVTPKPKRGL